MPILQPIFQVEIEVFLDSKAMPFLYSQTDAICGHFSSF